jgi:hypothetical protein
LFNSNVHLQVESSKALSSSGHHSEVLQFF